MRREEMLRHIASGARPKTRRSLKDQPQQQQQASKKKKSSTSSKSESRRTQTQTASRDTQDDVMASRARQQQRYNRTKQIFEGIL